MSLIYDCSLKEVFMNEKIINLWMSVNLHCKYYSHDIHVVLVDVNESFEKSQAEEFSHLSHLSRTTFVKKACIKCDNVINRTDLLKLYIKLRFKIDHECQKGINAVKLCSVENQKGAIAV